MARALIPGLLARGMGAERLAVGEPDLSQCAALARDFGVAAMADNVAAVAGAQLIVLAVKPQMLRAVLRPLADTIAREHPLLLSIVAGVQCADLLRACPGINVVRAMPNRAALVGAGVTALFAPESIGGTDRAAAEQVMAAAGRTVWVPRESDLDIVTAVSGSGPAYFFLLAEQLAAAATALGLDAGTAELLARQTLHGAGALCATPPTLAEQRAAVTSRGGTTEAALAELAQRGFAAAIAAAVAAAARRAAQLAAQFAADAR